MLFTSSGPVLATGEFQAGVLMPSLVPPPELYPILIAAGLALGLIAVIVLRGMAAFGRYSRRRALRSRSAQVVKAPSSAPASD